MKVISVNVGAIGDLFVRPSEHMKEPVRRIATGMHKRPVGGAVRVNRLGLDGDEQADPTVHGGINKAVYAYPSEHYGFWIAQRLAALKREEPLPPGAMGENLTLQGLLEKDLWIGDRLRIGTVLLEVTEPRQPCFKFNAKMGFSHAAKMMVQAGNSGFYLRVIEPGAIAAGDAIVLSAGPRETSIVQINERRLKGRQRDLF
ncbi:MOSC domain-containing protein [Noviherbaspirillum sp. Root189]|uniref:MOSC domain-containing protein n=1 Tax=Noviherbaspirillum sp. Root189 TaxID=1736487 RepID=UPI00070D9DA8|nr:MOSC domain-containing protein [Noviherbaspirillum sp. Root189]KRB94209.1 sulfurase [Noviherbaspirillum sp. Root189]